MRARAPVVAAIVLASGCSYGTPPIVDPVVHDIALVTTSFTDDFDQYGIKKTYARHDSVSGVLVIDLARTGARFEPAGPCGLVQGRVTVASESVTGSFVEADGGPSFTMSGSRDSSGAMVGSWECRNQNRGPHYFEYKGNFTLKRRP